MRCIRTVLCFAAIIPFTATLVAAAVRPLATPAPVSCAIPKPCAMFTNTSTGAALEGASASGTGLFGTSSSGVYYAPGVDGESSDSDGEDAGGAFGINVLTTGTAPQYGVIAYGNGIGVAGVGNSTGSSLSNSAYGVFGQDTVGTAAPNGDFNVGVVGASTVGTAILGEVNASPTVYGFGRRPIGVFAVAAPAGTQQDSPTAFYGETSSQKSNTYGMILNDDFTGNAFVALNPNYLIFATSKTGSVTIDYGGDETLTGTLKTSKGTYVRSTDATGTARIEYGDRATMPQVEDTGEGQLVGGRGYVSIDRDLANSIDRRSTYRVFVTPEGDCKGLYVTQKSASGFAVRELQGGRSALAFDYRIVAKPRGEDGARLAIAAPEELKDQLGMPHDGTSHRFTRAPLSPQDRLKARMGTQAYAQAMLELRAQRRAAQ